MSLAQIGRSGSSYRRSSPDVVVFRANVFAELLNGINMRIPLALINSNANYNKQKENDSLT